MSWRIHPSIGRPEAKIVWDNILYRTRLAIDGKEYKPNELIHVNISKEPKIELTLVGENIGDPGYVWGAITARSDEGIETLLMIKQNTLDTGDIIVLTFDEKIDTAFRTFMRTWTKYTEYIELIGYVGIGNIQEALRGFLPYAYIVDWRSDRVIVVHRPEDLEKTLIDLTTHAEVEIVGEVVVERAPVIQVMTIEPINRPDLGLVVRTADAGFNYYEMAVKYPDVFGRFISGILSHDWSGLAKIATDSTKNYPEVKK